MREELLRIADELDAHGGNMTREIAAESLRAIAEKAGSAEPTGRLTIEHFRGSRAMENIEFEYTGQLEPGTYRVYAAPPSQPVALPDDAMVERLAVWLRGNVRMRVSLNGSIDDEWNRDYARDILAAAFSAAPAGEGVQS